MEVIFERKDLERILQEYLKKKTGKTYRLYWIDKSSGKIYMKKGEQ